jgi:hypothetical protein
MRAGYTALSTRPVQPKGDQRDQRLTPEPSNLKPFPPYRAKAIEEIKAAVVAAK